MLPMVTLLGHTLPTYGVLAAAGVLLCIALILLRAPRYGRSREDCLYLFAFGLVGVMLGAKVLYLLTVLPQIAADLSLLQSDTSLFMQKYIYGGMVFYGGVTGGALACLGCARYFGWRLRDFFPTVVPVLPLAHGLGRVGCFCVGCCYGVPSRWGLAFTQSPIAPNGVPLLPVQLWEAGGDVVICLILMQYTRKRQNQLGVLGLYFVLYAPLRFVLECFRGDVARGFLGVLSTSQWLSLPVLAAGVALLVAGKMNAGREYSSNNEYYA